MSIVRVWRKQLLKLPLVRSTYTNYLNMRTHQRSDALIISFPKSGRTWLRVLIAKVISEKLGKEFTVEIERLSGDETPFIHVTHDASDMPNRALTLDKDRYRNKKVVFLARDPRDVVISYYFQCTKREELFTGGISSFIRHPGFGIDRIIDFMNIWATNRHVPLQYLQLKYEDCRSNPSGKLRELLKFLDIRDISDGLVSEAVAFGSFQNMKRMEKNGEVGGLRLTVRDSSDPEAYKVRKGKIGGYVEYLSDNDIKYVDDKVRDRLNKIYGYW